MAIKSSIIYKREFENGSSVPHDEERQHRTGAQPSGQTCQVDSAFYEGNSAALESAEEYKIPHSKDNFSRQRRKTMHPAGEGGNSVRGRNRHEGVSLEHPALLRQERLPSVSGVRPKDPVPGSQGGVQEPAQLADHRRVHSAHNRDYQPI